MEKVGKFSKCNGAEFFFLCHFFRVNEYNFFTSQHERNTRAMCERNTRANKQLERFLELAGVFELTVMKSLQSFVALKVSEAPEIDVYLQVIRTTCFSSLHRLVIVYDLPPSPYL